MEQEILQKLEELNKKVEKSAKQIQQMKKYFLWTLIVSIAVVVLPLIGLMFMIPQFISLYSNLGI
mgnify:CR=1 FL=1